MVGPDKYEFEAMPYMDDDGTPYWQVRYRLPGDDGPYAWHTLHTDQKERVAQRFVTIGEARHYARQWDERRLNRWRVMNQKPVPIWTTP